MRKRSYRSGKRGQWDTCDMMAEVRIIWGKGQNQLERHREYECRLGEGHKLE